jgi:Skp family chaperone for outer membrane proteins
LPPGPDARPDGLTDGLEVEEHRTVNRKVALAAAVAALGLAVYLGSRLWAQPPAGAVQAPAQTKVALVNLVQVIKNYHKYKTFEDEQKNLAKPFEERNKALQENLKQWQKVLENPGSTPQDKEKAEKEIKERKRQIEDNVAEFKRALGKRSDDQLVQLYREVEDATQRYAGNNGFSVVLQYNEPPVAAERYSAMNIQRKLQAAAATGCCIPVFIAPGLDITDGVVANLNGGQRANNGPQAGPPGGR